MSLRNCMCYHSTQLTKPARKYLRVFAEPLCEIKKGIAMNKIIVGFFVVVCIWVSLMSLTQRFKNPSLTETELFLLLPSNAVLIFYE